MANLLVNSGRAIMTNLIGVLGGTAPNYVGIGTGAGTTAVTDTTLFTEETTGSWSGYARANVTPTRSTTSVANDTIKWSATFTNPSAGTSQTITNAANFDALTAGNMYVKGDFAGVPLSPNDSITVNISQQMS